jgi:hypothetical protein
MKTEKALCLHPAAHQPALPQRDGSNRNAAPIRAAQ